MTEISSSELSRQFRVIRQEIDMHASLRDGYYMKGLMLDLAMIALSVILTGTSVLSEDNLAVFGLKNIYPCIQPIQTISSLVLLAISICIFKVDYKERSAMHKDACSKLSQLMELYRRNYNNDNEAWTNEAKDELHNTYWRIHDCIVPIPSSRFNQLKATYKRKVEISTLIDSYPHCPIWLMKTCLHVRYAVQFFKKFLIHKGHVSDE